MLIEIKTANQHQIIVRLVKDGQLMDEISDQNQFGSQVLLPAITKSLEKHKLAFTDIKEIKVDTGPGSFTGLRVGVSVANALGYALGVPVNGKKIESELSYN
jgi:tRNA threonylcarbamoyladenosine biosynthesis protein TsaB